MEVEIRQPGYLPWQAGLLQQALKLKQQQRLPHALLIEAGSAQDMQEFIWQLSMLLLCEAPQGSDFCDRCEACKLMRDNTYSDFRYVTLEYDEKKKKMNKNINIEQTRNLIHEVFLTRRFKRLKIAAIYPAEKMNSSSANSLLKTLEEPANEVLLILVSHSPGRLPVTIRSRCQYWEIPRASTQQAEDWLQQQGVSTEDSLLYLDFASGDPALALLMKQQGFAGIVDQFRSQFAGYLRGDNSVSALSSSLSSSQPSSIRRLIDMTLSAYAYQYSGLNSRGEPVDKANPVCARAVLSLQTRARRQLQVEDNNLNLQLQLEDVLISLKQIILRRSN